MRKERRSEMPNLTPLFNQKGFTLIELMIVVLIVGILSAVAIPTFRNFQSKAHRAELKANLGGIFMAQEAYYQENLRYGSFRESGFALSGISNRFSYRSPVTGGTGGSSNTVDEDVFHPRGGATYPENTVVPSAAALSPAAFTATATGDIDGDGPLDQWHINDLKAGLDDPDIDDIFN